MSLDTTRIHCTGCDFEHFETYKPIRLKCRTELGVVSYYPTSGWCYQCNRITDVEALPSLEEIQRHYARFYRVPSPETGWIKRLIQRFDKKYQQKCRELEAELAWRKARSAPPHCLKCGSADIAPLKFTDPNQQTADSDVDDWDILTALEYEGTPRDRRTVAKDFLHTCGGQLVHDPDDKPGSRYFWSEQVIWLDSYGAVVNQENEK